VQPPKEKPPESVSFDLEEALHLLAALEDSRDSRDDLIETDYVSALVQVEGQIRLLTRTLGLEQGGPDVH
jgi:hypothetical protein